MCVHVHVWVAAFFRIYHFAMAMAAAYSAYSLRFLTASGSLTCMTVLHIYRPYTRRLDVSTLPEDQEGLS